MSITLSDNTKAVLGRTTDGRRTIEYKALNKTVTLPHATDPNINLVQRLYNYLKGCK